MVEIEAESGPRWRCMHNGHRVPNQEVVMVPLRLALYPIWTQNARRPAGA
jgi:hypothetical protein